MEKIIILLTLLLCVVTKNYLFNYYSHQAVKQVIMKKKESVLKLQVLVKHLKMKQDVLNVSRDII